MPSYNDERLLNRQEAAAFLGERGYRVRPSMMESRSSFSARRSGNFSGIGGSARNSTAARARCIASGAGLQSALAGISPNATRSTSFRQTSEQSVRIARA